MTFEGQIAFGYIKSNFFVRIMQYKFFLIQVYLPKHSGKAVLRMKTFCSMSPIVGDHQYYRQCLIKSMWWMV